MDPIENLPPLRDVISREGLWAKKALGQNFLLDLNLTRRIARAAGDLSVGTVIEVGPGPGGLTRALLMEGANKVVVIEKDPRFMPVLEEIRDASSGRLEILHQDALQIDWTQWAEPLKIVANLPYNIATPLMLEWLQHMERYSSVTVMIQKEVAERLVAYPKTSAYGRLSVMAQWKSQVSKCFDVPPSAFLPPPKVVSTVVHFKARERSELQPSWIAMERLVAAAFGMRRKMLRSCLKGYAQNLLVSAMQRAGVVETQRAEELSVEQFITMAQVLQD